MRTATNAVPSATLICFIGLNLADIASTFIGLRMGLRESNALPSILYGLAGEFGIYWLKMLVLCLVALLVVRLSVYWPKVWRSLVVANVIIAAVVIGNIMMLVTG
ncbi:MAG TPA: DUF5658 family protein [Chloroflexota bacterium]|nr:DUF5658 family protein [Chloroflexota bacterium]